MAALSAVTVRLMTLSTVSHREDLVRTRWIREARVGEMNTRQLCCRRERGLVVCLLSAFASASGSRRFSASVRLPAAGPTRASADPLECIWPIWSCMFGCSPIFRAESVSDRTQTVRLLVIASAQNSQRLASDVLASATRLERLRAVGRFCPADRLGCYLICRQGLPACWSCG